MVPGCPGRLLSVLAGLVQERMGGTSGAVGCFPFRLASGMSSFCMCMCMSFQLYGLFLTSAAGHMTSKGRSDAAAWAGAMQAGTQAMRRCTKLFNSKPSNRCDSIAQITKTLKSFRPHIGPTPHTAVVRMWQKSFDGENVSCWDYDYILEKSRQNMLFMCVWNVSPQVRRR